MAASSGAHSERIPVSDYKSALRERFGAGNFRVRRDGRIDALCGAWVTFGRVGDPRTVETLFGDRPKRRQAGVVAVEFAIIASVLVTAVVGGCTTLDAAITERWPTVSASEVFVDAVVFHADRVAAAKAEASK